jgi:hypothetical protein
MYKNLCKYSQLIYQAAAVLLRWPSPDSAVDGRLPAVDEGDGDGAIKSNNFDAIIKHDDQTSLRKSRPKCSPTININCTMVKVAHFIFILWAKLLDFEAF